MGKWNIMGTAKNIMMSDKPHDMAKKYYYLRYTDIVVVYLTYEEKDSFIRKNWSVTLIPCE